MGYAATSSQHLPDLPVNQEYTRSSVNDASEDSEPELTSQRESVRGLADPTFADVKNNTRCRDDVKYDRSEDSEPELPSQRESVRDLEYPAFNDKDYLKECESACDLLFNGKQSES